MHSVIAAATLANALATLPAEHPAVAALVGAGLVIGLVIGLTGMGGGALLTPVMVLMFGVSPAAAVSSDVVVSLLIKPFGAAVHRKAGTIHWGIVRWLTTGSIPGALAGTALAHSFLSGHDGALRVAIGVTLLVAGGLMVRRLLRRGDAHRTQQDVAPPLMGCSTEDSTPIPPFTARTRPIIVRPLPTTAVGFVGGIFVGATSVGSGSLIMALLLGLYPMLRASHLVGTDLAQAVPLVAAAAVAHLFLGDVNTALVFPLVAGAIPGVIVGGVLSSRVAETWVRPAIATVLIGSGLKLVNVL